MEIFSELKVSLTPLGENIRNKDRHGVFFTSFDIQVKIVICVRNVKRVPSVRVKVLNCVICSEQSTYCRQVCVLF